MINITGNYNNFGFRQIASSVRCFKPLCRLSKSKASGLDTISARLIRDCADIISGPLSDLFN